MMNCKKEKALWTGGWRKVFRQYWTSLKSYILIPVKKKYSEATKKYFSSIYTNQRIDDLIFDGNENAYLEKARLFLDKNIYYDVIYDCGCGKASFLNFLKTLPISFGKYIGIDFAIQSQKKSNNIELINCDVVSYDYDVQSKKVLLVLCNVMCYMSNKDLDLLLKKLKGSHISVLVVDPIPGLFWDATFDNVKLYYRTIKKTNELMQKYGFSSNIIVKDYLLQVGPCYLIALSYATMYEIQ